MSGTLLVVGSGVSTNLGMPSWASIFREIAASTGDVVLVSSINARLSNNEHYLAASELGKALGTATLERKIVAILQTNQDRIIRKSKKIAQWSALPRMGFAGVVTTNWDTLHSYLLPSYAPLIWPINEKDELTHLDEASAIILSDRPFVWYLHGNIDRGNLVVTEEQRNVRANRIRLHMTKLVSLLMRFSTNIIGTELPDDHVVDWLTSASMLNGAHALHLILFEKSDRATISKRVARIGLGVKFREFASYSRLFSTLREEAYARQPLNALINIMNAKDVTEFKDILSMQKYDYKTVQLASGYISMASDQIRFLTWASEIILTSTSSRDIELQGICASLLSKHHSWKPDKKLADALYGLCVKITCHVEVAGIGILEPLAFALGRYGNTAAIRSNIDLMIRDNYWRNADIIRVGGYYGDDASQIVALDSHVMRSGRRGLLRANDITRLEHLLETFPTHPGRNDLIKRLILPALEESIRSLFRNGSDKLGKAVRDRKEMILKKRGIR